MICKSLDDLLKEYVALYGKATLAMSTYSSNVGLIDHYISPIIGKKKNEFLTPHTVRSIHKLLHSCFEQAVKWELMEKNPTDYVSVPKAEYKKRDIWTAEPLFQALEATLLKLHQNPKMAALLKTLAKSL